MQLPVIQTLCGGCKFWYTADQVNHLPEWGECLAGEGKDDQAVMAETLVYAKDMSSYRACLETNRRFGCVMGVPGACDSNPERDRY